VFPISVKLQIGSVKNS